jgi:hypothetical protein
MLARDPASLETLTMRPWPLARSSGSRLRLVCQAPSRLISRASRTTPEVGGGCLLPGVVVDGRVVDQDVEVAIAAVEVGRDLLDGGWVADIQLSGQHALVGG